MHTPQLTQQTVQDLALMLSVNCVRNTVIETYHANGQLSQEDMCAFNREVANKVYTFLEYLINQPTKERTIFLRLMRLQFPHEWDLPSLDPSFTTVMNEITASTDLDELTES